MSSPAADDSPWLNVDELDFAEPLQRVGAGAVDWALALAVAGGAASLASRIDVSGEGPELVAATIAIWFVHLFIYPALTGMLGWTPGKRLFGLRVITADLGEMPPGRGTALRRNVPLCIGVIPLVGPYAVLVILVGNVVVVLRDPKHRSFYDRVGNTFVVRA